MEIGAWRSSSPLCIVFAISSNVVSYVDNVIRLVCIMQLGYKTRVFSRF